MVYYQARGFSVFHVIFFLAIQVCRAPHQKVMHRDVLLYNSLFFKAIKNGTALAFIFLKHKSTEEEHHGPEHTRLADTCHKEK